MSERKSRPDWPIACELAAREAAAGRVLQVVAESTESSVRSACATRGSVVAEEVGDRVPVEAGAW